MKFDYKKSLGQNFLKDQNIINKIADSINPNANDLIIEIGPGSGALTKKLVLKESKVLCFEIDNRLKSILESIKSEKLEIIFEDFLKINLKEHNLDKYNHLYFVGNLPYYITTSIINKIVRESDPYEITIMIQKEVANRYMAKPNSRDYSSISIFLQYNFDISKICDVSKNCFEPVPKVDSTVIKLKKKENKEYLKNEELFYKLIKDSFKSKRKNLRNNLKEYNLEVIEKVLNKYGKDLTYRAEQIEINEFIDIANNL